MLGKGGIEFVFLYSENKVKRGDIESANKRPPFSFAATITRYLRTGERDRLRVASWDTVNCQGCIGCSSGTAFKAQIHTVPISPYTRHCKLSSRLRLLQHIRMYIHICLLTISVSSRMLGNKIRRIGHREWKYFFLVIYFFVVLFLFRVFLG